MAKAEGLPPTASTVVPGLSLNYAGNWAYAYSGSVAVSSSEISLLDFTSGAGIIVGFFNSQFGFEGNTNDDYLWRVYLNDLAIMAINITSAKDLDANRVDIIIPPFTHVKVTAVNATQAVANKVGGNITGRVYDV
jgi:hypothetical protein